MRKIYRIASRRGSVATKVAVVVAVAAVTGLATRVHPLGDAVGRTEARPLSETSTPAQQPYYYFPSQFELHAGPPEPHIEAF